MFGICEFLRTNNKYPGSGDKDSCLALAKAFMEANKAENESNHFMDEIDDDELEAELDGLSDLEDMEEPDYLEANDMPVVNAQETVTDNNADAGEKETDDFGLPVAAQ